MDKKICSDCAYFEAHENMLDKTEVTYICTIANNYLDSPQEEICSSFEQCNDFTGNEVEAQKQSTDKAFALCGVRFSEAEVCKIKAYKNGKCTLYVNQDCYKCSFYLQT